MLFTQILTPETHRLLVELMKDPLLSPFNLVGGTALALQLGHRKSIDLDLFSQEPIDVELLHRHLSDKYGFVLSYSAKDTLKGDINGVKIDCITYTYPHLRIPIQSQGIRLLSPEDIAAMKLSAIVYNGTRAKDFTDIACLSCKMPLNRMVECFLQKYPNISPVIPIKGLGYFDDVVKTEKVEMIGGGYDWPMIETRIKQMLSNPNKIFREMPVRLNTPRRGLSM